MFLFPSDSNDSLTLTIGKNLKFNPLVYMWDVTDTSDLRSVVLHL